MSDFFQFGTRYLTSNGYIAICILTQGRVNAFRFFLWRYFSFLINMDRLSNGRIRYRYRFSKNRTCHISVLFMKSFCLFQDLSSQVAFLFKRFDQEVLCSTRGEEEMRGRFPIRYKLYDLRLSSLDNFFGDLARKERADNRCDGGWGLFFRIRRIYFSLGLGAGISNSGMGEFFMRRRGEVHREAM